jgi:hypothetical protein
MTIMGAIAAHVIENGIWGVEGILGGAVFGAIFGVVFGLVLGIAITRTQKRGAWSCLWSALLHGVMLGAMAGALTGVLAAWTGSTLWGVWGAVSGFCFAVTFGYMPLFVVTAFWDNAKLNGHVVLGAIVTGLMAALIALVITTESFGVDGVSGGAILGTAAGTVFGAIMGARLAAGARSAWWTVIVGGACGAVAGSMSGALSAITGSVSIAGVLGVPIGAFLFATQATITSELQAWFKLKKTRQE